MKPKKHSLDDIVELLLVVAIFGIAINACLAQN